MECKVPIEFEFEVLQTRPNPCFSISPLKGVLPAHEAVTVEITFMPNRLQTEDTELEVGGCTGQVCGWVGSVRLS